MGVRERVIERLERYEDLLMRSTASFHSGSHERGYMCACLAEEIRSDKWDDIFGVPDPTLEEVKAEAVRVFGEDISIGHHGSLFWVTINKNADHLWPALLVPDLKAAYAALRTMEPIK